MELDHRIVNSLHGEAIKYRVSLRIPKWDNQGRTAIKIVMQYDGVPNWRMPADVLIHDLPNVLEAIRELNMLP